MKLLHVYIENTEHARIVKWVWSKTNFTFYLFVQNTMISEDFFKTLLLSMAEHATVGNIVIL